MTDGAQDAVTVASPQEAVFGVIGSLIRAPVALGSRVYLLAPSLAAHFGSASENQQAKNPNYKKPL